MRHALSVLALTALLTLCPVGAAVGTAGAMGVTDAPLPETAATPAEHPDQPTLTIAIHLRPDGDARWKVAARYPLNDTAERDAFDSLATDFESGGLKDGLSVDVFRAAAATVDERVNRSMAVRSVSRNARIVESGGGNATGTLTLSFTWTNFANASNGRLTVGDAFAGGWFGDLGETQTLLVYPPEGYTVQSVSPSTRFQDGALQWMGPREFERGPQITLTAGTGSQLPVVPAFVAVFGALVLGGLVVYFWYGPRREGEQGVAGGPGKRSGESGTESPTVESAEREGEGETAEPAPESGAGDETETPVDEELLSDEERVERLLEEHGGRMKQAKIVEETRWSNAKVSQLLSSMAEEGRVEKLRIGRENLISLPDAEEETGGEE